MSRALYSVVLINCLKMDLNQRAIADMHTSASCGEEYLQGHEVAPM